MTTEFEKRGVQNPKIIDLISLDKSDDTVVLHMIEPRPWLKTKGHFLEIEDKFNSYLAYVLDGFLAKHYPQYAAKMVRFVFECAACPSRDEEPFITAMKSYALSHNIDFELKVLTDEERENLATEFESKP